MAGVLDPKTIEGIANEGKKFAENFYKGMDRTRTELLQQYYSPDTTSVIWNGTAHRGQAAIEFLTRLPTSNHILDSVDCQPLQGLTASGPIPVIISCTGTVRYDAGNVRPFHQSLLLVPRASGFFIADDCLRFLD